MNGKSKLKRTSEGELYTELILELFKLNGVVLAAGDQLVESLNLTSARWQVLGAIREKPLPVAQIAREMGLTRQSVQRTANKLEETGFITFLDNPHHKRARLVHLTSRACNILETVDERQIQWANLISKGMPIEELANALNTMRNIRERLRQDMPDSFSTTRDENTLQKGSSSWKGGAE
jgi:DNA-binding MarR family transcriptional regulator